MKKFQLAGGVLPLICLMGVGEVKAMADRVENKITVWKEGDPDPGFVLGTAIQFVPMWLYDHADDKHIDSDGIERVACLGCHSHYNIYNHLRWDADHPYAVSGNDDKQTQYGFVTSNGYFVNRAKAGQIWKMMLSESKWRDDSFMGEYTPNLYSYNLKPEVIEHFVEAANTQA